MPAASMTTPAGRVLAEPPARPDTPSRSEVAATTGESLVEPASPADRPTADAVSELRGRALRLPIDGARVEAMKGGFAERRDAGGRSHEAVDILAPRNTPIHAVENGTIAKLFMSKAGGLTIYQFDPTERFCYYYAHLERYAAGLRDGQKVSRGDVIGYVGTSGNARRTHLISISRCSNWMPTITGGRAALSTRISFFSRELAFRMEPDRSVRQSGFDARCPNGVKWLEQMFKRACLCACCCTRTCQVPAPRSRGW
jgi:hypothetical protein